MEKRIIILTKSRKHSGYCIAGIDCDTGEWIRLVSSNVETERAVPLEQLQYSSGEYLEVYDVISCKLEEQSATIVQPENYIYDESVSWEKVGESNLEEVINIHGGYDFPNYVFENGDTKLESNWIFKGNPSLYLLKVQDAAVWVKTFDKKTVSLNFTYNGIQYKYMKISQIDIINHYKDFDDGLYPLGTVAIVVSLTDKYYYNGKYYKLVAQIL